MLRYLPLIWAALARRRLRTILTLLSVTAAFTLFGVMMGTDAAFQQMVAVINRSVVVIGARFADNLTDGMGQEIAAMPNVGAVSAGGTVFGYYRNPKTQAYVMMVDQPSSWPNVPLSPAQWEELRERPDGVFISRMVATRLGLKKGSHYAIIAAGIPRADGGQSWQFQVLDVLDDTPYWANGFSFGSYQYFKMSRPLADQPKAGWFQAVVKDPVRADDTAMAVDARFANSAIPTDSISERAMRSDGATAAVNVAAVTRRVALIGLFMILLLTGHGMAQSVNERLGEFAVLKTIGYSTRRNHRLGVRRGADAGAGWRGPGTCGGRRPERTHSRAAARPGRSRPLPIVRRHWRCGLCGNLAGVSECDHARPETEAAGRSRDPGGPDMIFLRACLAAIWLNLVSLRRRIGSALVVVAGVTCVVGVLLSMLSVTVGLRQAWQRAGSPDRAIIMPAGVLAEGNGNISPRRRRNAEQRAGHRARCQGPGHFRCRDFDRLGDPARKSGGRGFLLLRSFGAMALAVRPEFRIVAGRMYQPGKHEMIVGAEAPGQFLGVGLGDKVTMPDGQWPVVGVFKTNDDVVQSELVADGDTVMAVLRKRAFNSVIVRLAGEGGLAALKRSLGTNPALSLTAERQSDYYSAAGGAILRSQ